MNNRGYIISVVEDISDDEVIVVLETVPQRKKPTKKLLNRIRQAFPESKYSVRLAWVHRAYQYYQL